MADHLGRSETSDRAQFCFEFERWERVEDLRAENTPDSVDLVIDVNTGRIRVGLTRPQALTLGVMLVRAGREEG